MVQIKTSIALIALVAAVAPVLAAPVQGEAVELQEREPFGLGSAFKIARKVVHHHGVKHAAHGAAHGFNIATSLQNQQQRRELDGEENELSARTLPHLHFPAGFRRLPMGHGPVVLHRPPPFYNMGASQPQRREFDDDLDLESREPRFGAGRARRFMHGMRHMHHRIAPPSPPQDAPAQKRELVDDALELEAREPRFGMGRARRFIHGMRHHRHVAAPPSPPQDAPAQKRELVDDDLELEAREPRFGMGRARRFMHGMRHHRHAAPPPQDAPVEARELADEEFELMARDLSDEELELLAREPLSLPTVNFEN